MFLGKFEMENPEHENSENVEDNDSNKWGNDDAEHTSSLMQQKEWFKRRKEEQFKRRRRRIGE